MMNRLDTIFPGQQTYLIFPLVLQQTLSPQHCDISGQILKFEPNPFDILTTELSFFEKFNHFAGLQHILTNLVH